MRIRPATVLDIPALAAVHEASWRNAYAGLLPGEVIDRATARLEERWQANLAAPSRTTWVAAVDDELAGFLHLDAVGPGHPTPLRISALYLRPERVGAGIGTALLEYGVGDMPAHTAVLKANERAAGFWASRGFVPFREEAAEAYGGATIVHLVRGTDRD